MMKKEKKDNNKYTYKQTHKLTDKSRGLVLMLFNFEKRFIYWQKFYVL